MSPYDRHRVFFRNDHHSEIEQLPFVYLAIVANMALRNLAVKQNCIIVIGSSGASIAEASELNRHVQLQILGNQLGQ